MRKRVTFSNYIPAAMALHAAKNVLAAKRRGALPLAFVALCASLASVIPGSAVLNAFAGTSLKLRESPKPQYWSETAPATLRWAQDPQIATDSQVAGEVRWLDPLDNDKTAEITPADDATVLPVFPLGGPFMPCTKPLVSPAKHFKPDASSC